MTAIGDVLGAGRWQQVYNRAYIGASFAFVVLMARLLVAHRGVTTPARPATRKPAFVSAGVLALALVVGAATSVTIKTNQQQLDTWFSNLVLGDPHLASLGFPERARLNSIGRLKEEDGKATALRVASDHSPGYLRGLAYDTFAGSEWSITCEARPAQRVSHEASTRWREATYNTYLVSENAPPAKESMTVWPEVQTKGTLFTTLNSRRLSGPFDSLTLDANGNVKAFGAPSRTQYTVEDSSTRPAPPALSAQERTKLTAVPPDLDPAIARLGESLFAGLTKPRDRIAAVLRYFKDHYEYQLDLTVPPDQDPLTYFLLEQPPAHCEYFATGAAVLLRLGGVPCRYVTGYVPAERNTFGGYWVARSRDAHAWVEAYEDGVGWYPVEATVAAGVPSSAGAAPSRMAQLWDYLKFIARDAVAAFAMGGLRGVFIWLGAAILDLVGFIIRPIPATILGGALVLLLVRRWRRRATKRNSPTALPQVVKLQRLLKVVDRRIAKLGITRMTGETLHHFAGRLECEHATLALAREAAHWYRDYAAVRFGNPLSGTAFDSLRDGAPQSSALPGSQKEAPKSASKTGI
jgi:transglutaminase-like putative cysteine protease